MALKKTARQYCALLWAMGILSLLMDLVLLHTWSLKVMSSTWVDIPDRSLRSDKTAGGYSQPAEEEDFHYETAPPQNYADDDLLNQPYVSYQWVRHTQRSTNAAVSPYEKRWNGCEILPQEHEHMVPQIHGHTYPLPPADKAVCFVHLGKTGGSTIGCGLGFGVHCPQKRRRRKGVLPEYATHMIHNGVNNCADDMPYYLWTLRNPLDRIRSAYVYDRKAVEVMGVGYEDNGQTALYMECPFYTLNDLALRGLAEDGTAPDFCKRRAQTALRGISRHGYHMYYNHEWFMKASKVFDHASDSKILVIRNEHMADDWNSAERLLSDGETEVRLKKLPSFNEGEAKRKLFDDKYLTPVARGLLCEALCNEIQHYKRILREAVNLSPEDKALSLTELAESCPDEAKAATCGTTPTTDIF